MTKKFVKFLLIILCFSFLGLNVSVRALSESQKESIANHCDKIKDSLKKVQKDDSRARVYLGAYYETILTKFITPLNIRLVENNLSDVNLIENQNKFAEAKLLFSNDFINYQKGLEELVAMNCEEEPEDFYEKIELVRDRRKIMVQDVLKLRSLISEHIKYVNEIKGKV